MKVTMKITIKLTFKEKVKILYLSLKRPLNRQCFNKVRGERPFLKALFIFIILYIYSIPQRYIRETGIYMQNMEKLE